MGSRENIAKGKMGLRLVCMVSLLPLLTQLLMLLSQTIKKLFALVAR